MRPRKQNVDFADGTPLEHFFLGDILETDGGPRQCCPREFVAAPSIQTASGLEVIAAFEHEFVYAGIAWTRALQPEHLPPWGLR